MFVERMKASWGIPETVSAIDEVVEGNGVS